MPKFGPRKIGRAQFELQKVRQAQKKKFGPRKFGAKKAAIMARQIEEAEAAVAQERAPAQATEPQGKAPVEEATTSVRQMAKALGENIALLDDFIELEKQRPNGVRKTALKLFLGTEMGKEDKARDEVLEELQQLLKG